ncbi:MAG: zinc ribbon domain-containing protein [Thermoplasmata archaeon]
MPDEELPEMPSEAEEAETHPPKGEIRIVELSEPKHMKEGICRVCGKLKAVYIEIESGGVTEYTCEECYEKAAMVEERKCKSCGASLKPEDVFCGKCGKPTVRKCPGCNAQASEEDLFCGKCGTKL